MNNNMDTLARRLRGLLIAPVAVVAGIVIGPASVSAVVLYALAVTMLATSAAGYCPLYSLVGLCHRPRPRGTLNCSVSQTRMTQGGA